MALASPWLERRRREKVVPFLEPPLLDVGCGRCVAFESVPDGYVGIDLERQSLRLPSCPAGRVMQGSAQGLPFAAAAFRTVLLMAVVEHLPDPKACLVEAMRVLQPGGCIVITTPTPRGDAGHHLLAKVGITSKHAAEEHQSIFSPSALRELIEEIGGHVLSHKMFLLGGNQVCVAQLKRDTRAPA